MEIGSEGGAEFLVTFQDVTNPGDVALLISHPESLVGAGATVVAREVRAPRYVCHRRRVAEEISNLHLQDG